MDRMMDRNSINTFGELGVFIPSFDDSTSIDSDMKACGIRGEIRPSGGEFIPLKDDPKWRECKPSIPQD